MLRGGKSLLKRVNNLYEKLISDQNLSEAIDEVNRTHHWKKGHKPNRCSAWVEETKPDRIKELRKIIENGFIQKEPKVTERWDPSAQKTRIISEPIQWPDQYVHHALIQVLQPVFMRGMDYWCCGSIRGRGGIHEKKAIEKWLRYDPKGTRYSLCADIRHFYDSLTPDVVMRRMRELVKDHKVLDLVERIISAGIKIGAFTSQWFANVTLQPLDMTIRQSGLCRHYARYMDNLTVFGSNKRKLRQLKYLIEDWLRNNDLEIKHDWQVFPCDKRLPNAVGYRYGLGYTIPRKHNLIRMRRAVKRYVKKRDRGERIPPGMVLSILSRLGQLKNCNNTSIYKELFNGQKIQRELKNIIRRSLRKELTWSMYLEQREIKRSLKQRAKRIAI
jgi:hypothetical protein